MKKLLTLAFVAAAIFMTACRGGNVKIDVNVSNTDSIPWYENMEALDADLKAAIDDARELDSSKISNTLMPIKKGTPNEEWQTIDGKDMVLSTPAVCRSSSDRKASIRLTAKWALGSPSQASGSPRRPPSKASTALQPTCA